MNISNDLLEKYFRDEATPDEVQTVLRWFKTDEGQRYLQQRLDKDFEKLNDNRWLSIHPLDTDKMLEKIYATDTTSISRPTRKSLYLKIAAGLILLTLFTTYFVFLRNPSITYETAYGEKKEIVLPDKSTVILNGNSSLTISRDWDNLSKREVWMRGEAFFRVFHTQNHNDFIVHTSDNFNVQVLGTEFNVLNREQITKVALEKGNVRLNFKEKGKSSNLTMKPGEMVEFNEKSAFLIKKETRVKNITSWKEPSMVFSQTSVEEIADMLKNTYGLTLIVDDPSILTQKISGTVPNKNVDLFLQGLSEILEVKMRKDQNFVYLNTPNDTL